MIEILEAVAMMDRIIAQEVVNNDKAGPEEIAKIVKARIDGVEEVQGLLSCIPMEHIKNLVRKKMKINELMTFLGDPEGRDKEIRKELLDIDRDIQKTRPNFLVREVNPSRN